MTNKPQTRKEKNYLITAYAMELQQNIHDQKHVPNRQVERDMQEIILSEPNFGELLASYKYILDAEFNASFKELPDGEIETRTGKYPLELEQAYESLRKTCEIYLRGLTRNSNRQEQQAIYQNVVDELRATRVIYGGEEQQKASPRKYTRQEAFFRFGHLQDLESGIRHTMTMDQNQDRTL